MKKLLLVLCGVLFALGLALAVISLTLNKPVVLDDPIPASVEAESAASSALVSQESQPQPEASSKAASSAKSEAASSAQSAPSAVSSAPTSSLTASAVSSAVSAASSLAVSSAATSSENLVVSTEGELRGVWVSFYELTDITDEAEYKARIDAMFDTIRDTGLNAVFFHVHSHGDSFYYSSVFPFSHRIGFTDSEGNRIQGVDPGYDPLAYAVKAAHARGLQLHAWFNPYRVWTSSNNIYALSADNPARILMTDDDPTNDSAVVITDSAIYYNPASEIARGLIVSAIEEVTRNYAVDGIHFDDYFYPTTDAGFDRTDYTAYTRAGGLLSLSDWRRENVNKLIRRAYAAVKAIRDIPFGISPSSNIARSTEELYADVALWGSSAGYVDYLMPQIYFGFNHATMPFLPTLEKWTALVTNPTVTLYVGLPAYKLGNTDTYAGVGKNEFKTDTEILKRMVEAVRKSGAGGFVLYSYPAVADSKNADEINALRALLQ